MKKYFVITLVASLLTCMSFAQLPIKIQELTQDDNVLGYKEDTLRQWILTRLHGGGGLIDTASIKFIGDHRALGRFWDGRDMGLDSGLIISNGKVTSATPPNNSGLMSDKLGTPGDSDLLGMYNMIFVQGMGGKDTAIEYTGDAAVIEFTYRPFGEEIVLDYVYASEEYAYIRDPDVDLTGFPSGTPSNQIYDLFGISMERTNQFNNLALRIEDAPPPGTPDLKRWVNVGNINPTNYGDYFQPNPTGPAPIGINLGTQFDGFTKQIGNQGKMYVRRRDVTPCATYKVKIAIEDFWFDYPSNEQLDGFSVNSALLLGAGSLRGGKNQPGWSASHRFTDTSFEGDLIEGGCNNVELTFTLDETVDRDYYIPFRVLADAYRDKFRVSYLSSGEVITDDSVRIESNSAQVTILLEAVNLTADISGVSFQYAANPCEKKNTVFGFIFSGKIPLNLRNNDPFTFTQNPKNYEAYCKETLDLTVSDVTQGGVSPVDYLWNGGLPAQEVFPYQVESDPDFVTVTVSDGCGNSDDVQVKIVNKTIELTDLLGGAFLCGPGQTADVEVTSQIPDYPDYTIDQVRWYKLPGNTPLGNTAGNVITVLYDNLVGDGIWQCGFEVTDCCGGTQTGSFEVNQSELTLGDDVWICKGQTYDLIANAEAQKFAWYAVSNPTDTLSFTNSVSVTPNVTTTYELWILDNCVQEQTASITVNVDQFVPDFTITPNTAEICPGELITLSAGLANSWEWQPGGMTTQSIDLNPTIPNTYTYTLTASSDYCLDKQVSKDFTVFPKPVSTFTFSPDSEACTGEDIVFTYSGGNPDVFIWDFGDGTTSSDRNPVHAYQMANTYDISLHVDQHICSNDSSAQMTINPLPAPDFSANIQSSNCLPVEVQFSDLTQDAFPNAELLWDFGDGTTSTEKNPFHEYTTVGLFSVTLTVNNTDRCGATIIQPNLIEANPNPEAVADADPWITTLDTPEIVFASLSVSEASIVTWEWDFGDGSAISNEENPSHTYVQAGDYEIKLYVKTIDGCWDTTYAQVALTEEVRLFFPNAFTPNGDGVNDVFEIKGTPISDFNLYIFDRWGGQVFSTHSFENKWDGTSQSGEPVAPGTYGYQVKGTDYLLRPLNFTGTVTVVR